MQSRNATLKQDAHLTVAACNFSKQPSERSRGENDASRFLFQFCNGDGDAGEWGLCIEPK